MKECEYEYDSEVDPHFEKDLDSIRFENIISKNDNDFFYFNNFESEDSLYFFLNMDKISVNCHSEKSLDMNISLNKENKFNKRFKVLNIPKIGEFFKISKMFKNYRKGRIKKYDNYIGKHNKFSVENI